ncbi:MAG: pseudaminic acid cytidylyltransferase [Thermodesulfobacteriota bacterium]
MQPSALAIIPARGGSKRIPRKNIKPFAGEPIIRYSIRAALMSGCFSEVMVSTEDKEIADVASRCGATIPFRRSEKTADDQAMLADVIEEVVLEYQKRGRRFDLFCCILPTAPFISGDRIKEAYDLLVRNDVDSVFPVTRFSYPIQRALRIENGLMKMFWPENYNVRSQDLEPAFHDSGQFYWMKTASLLRQKQLFAEKSIGLELPESEVQDIDNEEDWKVAEMKYTLLQTVQGT